MNITLKLNDELIKYGLCHIYSDINLSKPVILSDGNGACTNTITANVNGVVQLTATNCPSSIYCIIETSPSYVNSANFRLKTGEISGVSPSGTAKTVNMGFNSSNIFVATNTKCAIGFDLLTLGYRYSLGKITPSNYTIPTGTTTNMVLYNKAFTYKAINSLDKTYYSSTITQTSFGSYSSPNATNMINTTRGVNLTVPTLSLSSTSNLGALYKQSGYGITYSIVGDNFDATRGITHEGIIEKHDIIVPNSTAPGSYNIWENGETNPAGKLINGVSYDNTIYGGKLLDTHWLPMCRFTVDNTSFFPEFANTSNGIKFSITSGAQLRFTYKYPDNLTPVNDIYFKVCLCKINEIGSPTEYYKPIYRYNSEGTAGYLVGGAEHDILFNFPTSISSSISFEQGATYIYFLRLVVQNPNDFAYMYFNFTTNNTYLNHSLTTNMPGKVVTFNNVNKNPLVPVYIGLKSTIVSCKLSYLQISYPNYSYSLGNSSNSLGKDTSTSVLRWLNANPARIGVSGSVSYTNLYSGINLSAKNNMSSTRNVYTYAYVAKATPAVCYNGFTTTQWYKKQSTKSYTTNNIFDISTITSTNIKYSINEVLSGKHKLTKIYVQVDS